jgi:hypothetical protein
MFKSIATAVLAVSFAGAAMADEKKSAAFLAASSDGQIGYISASLSMAQALLSKPQGECIGKYAASNHSDCYKEIIDTIKKYDAYTPSSVVAAAIEKHCGSFQLATR